MNLRGLSAAPRLASACGPPVAVSRPGSAHVAGGQGHERRPAAIKSWVPRAVVNARATFEIVGQAVPGIGQHLDRCEA